MADLPVAYLIVWPLKGGKTTRSLCYALPESGEIWDSGYGKAEITPLSPQAALEQARAEIERLRVDAERYRVLRNDTATEFGEPWAITRYAPGDERNSDGGTCPLIGEELDVACDALIELLSPTPKKE